ncbi:hypothetical protein [Persicobacter diffluens]|uniref:Uncharacterized protein n=1 Tax=Persicobacter diffluens TaxID=981 RepID=A0AAN5ANP0_9BACT|nr:hypothetical protein PEDI_55440 [Persicobacter diffluens]
MPLNLLKTYNDLLDLDAFSAGERVRSLRGVFDRDFANVQLLFNSKVIEPTPKDGEDTMDTLFAHLTTVMEKGSRHRRYDPDRSKRLHWVKHHIELTIPAKIDSFSVKEPEGIRTYLYDHDERYVIILEPKRNGSAYYLLTAYHLKGKDAQRDKIRKKMKRKLNQLH